MPNTSAGRAAFNHLGELGRQDFGCQSIKPLSVLLRGREDDRLAADRLLEKLPYQFYRLDIESNSAAASILKILSWHDNPVGEGWHGHILAIEPNFSFGLSSPDGIGTPFELSKWHQEYLKQMNVDCGRSRGEGAPSTVAVVDTGCVGLDFVQQSYDLTDRSPTFRVAPGNQNDVNGHGTAISTLIHEVAPDAIIKTVRITNRNPDYQHVLAGLAVAVADCGAEIVNLSMGFQSFGIECGACGATGLTRAIAMEKMLIMLQRVNRPGLISPIFVAAAGNHAGEPRRDGSGMVTGFDYPAASPQTVAVGCSDVYRSRVAFSQYGDSNPSFLLAPGGKDDSESVGNGGEAAFFGTSASAAYVSGILAVMRRDQMYRSLEQADLIAALLGMCIPPDAVHRAQYGKGVVVYR
jgi:hypothetical protein